MAALLERIAAATRPFIWLDDTSYVARLLGGGRIPWLDVAELIALRRTASALLQPNVVVLPVTAVIDVCLAADPELLETMRTKKRTVAPLRVLLADPNARARLLQVAQALRRAFTALPFVLALPSPRSWVAAAHAHAFGSVENLVVGAEESDAGAVYVAEFLRAFGELDISGVLLQESAGAEPTCAAEIAWYKPVINLCAHYRWDLGLQLPSAATFAGALEEVEFVIAPRPVPGAIIGIATAPDFWSGGTAPPLPAAGFRFARIPPEGVPEQVLERLALLRSA